VRCEALFPCFYEVRLSGSAPESVVIQKNLIPPMVPSTMNQQGTERLKPL